MKLSSVLFVLVLILSGCVGATNQNPDQVAQATATMANTLTVTKETVIDIFTTISDNCQRKFMDTQTCAKAEKLYLQIQPAIDAAEQSVIIAASTGDLTQANANQAAVNGLVAELMTIKGVN